MSIVKSDFIQFKGIDLRGNWYERALGSLEKCVNIVPHSLNYENNTYDTVHGGLVPAKTTDAVDPVYYPLSGTQGPCYFGGLFNNVLSGKVASVTIGSDKKVYVKRVMKLSLSDGDSAFDVYAKPIVRNNTIFIGLSAPGNLTSGTMVRISGNPTDNSGSITAKVVGSATNSVGAMVEHKGTIYYTRFMKGEPTELKGRVHYENLTGGFGVNDFFDMDRQNQVYNMFVIQNNLYAYHEKGITRILGDQTNGFTLDEVATFEGGSPVGGKVDGFYDGFLFSIGDKPYLFDGSSIAPTLNGVKTTIYDVSMVGPNIAVIPCCNKITNTKYYRAWLLWDMESNQVWGTEASASLSGASIFEHRVFSSAYRYRVGTANASYRYHFTYSTGGTKDSWLGMGFDGNTSPTVTTNRMQLQTNPIALQGTSIPRQIDVHAAISGAVTITAYVANQCNQYGGEEPTWTSGIVQNAPAAGQRTDKIFRYRVAFPELQGNFVRYKLKFAGSAGATFRLYGMEFEANVIKRPTT